MREKGREVKMQWMLLFIILIGSARSDHVSCNIQNTQKRLEGETSQSSDYYDEIHFTSERAIDGDLCHCAHTLAQQNSWWRIDLLGVYSISSVSMYNFKTHNIYMNGTQIHIGNSRENNGTANRMCANITDFPPDSWNDFECNLSGRYITVFSPPSRFLALCEVTMSGTKKESPFKLIRERMTWEDALYYCREHYTDLASILDEETQAWAELEARNALTDFVWLGLHYTCTLEFWFWVEDHPVDFHRWAPGNDTGHCDMSGAMQTQGDHLWLTKSDYDQFNFICTK